MNDDKLGFVSPEEFIKVAEQTGLISQIGEIVFKKVCAFISENDPMQYGLDYIEVNLSTIQCMDPDLYDSFIRIMKKYHVPASAINFEITESAMIQNVTAMEDVTGKFRQDGFNFSLDDFGTGNSNFSYLIRYPFKLIKIDKSFLWNSEKNHKNAIVLKNMLELIKDLGKDTVVEGVETAAQRDMLRADGVRYLQGYFYSKPVPPDDFLKYLKDFNSESSIEKHHA
jgi:EAL domain-containing protein (putative c-di-GMP-specific phosphodiesterase class I)